MLYQEPVLPGQVFTLSYVHSSEQIPVRGVFVVQPDGSLRVRETAFAGFGPGMPALRPGDTWRYEDGMIVAAGPPDPLPELRLRLAPVTRHRLLTPSGVEIDLTGLVPPGDAVRIVIR